MINYLRNYKEIAILLLLLQLGNSYIKYKTPREQLRLQNIEQGRYDHVDRNFEKRINHAALFT